MQISERTPVTLLTPVLGSPGPADSSIGGPLLWPADESWPRCLMPDDRDQSGVSPCAMVPVVQLYRRDVPGGWWPEGVDLFQLLWCPNEHWGPPMAGQLEGGPMVFVRWRRAAEAEGRGQCTPVAPVRFEEWLVPRTCLIETEETVEPAGEPISRYDVWKMGGRPRWSTTDEYEHSCANCDVPMRLLLTVSSGDVTGVDVSGGGELRLFTCPTDAEHGYDVDLQ